MSTEASPDLTDSRITSLDRIHKSQPFYKRIDLERVKRDHQLAFAVYQRALKDGDLETAEMAKERFLNASNILSGQRRTVL